MSKFRVGERVRILTGADEGAEGIVIPRNHVPITNRGIIALDGHYDAMNSRSVPVLINVVRYTHDEKWNVTGRVTKTIMDVYDQSHVGRKQQ